MNGSMKKKQKFCISVIETAEKLRILADELERGVVTINEEECPIALDTSVEISMKAKDDKFSTRLKFKLAIPSVDKKATYLRKDEQVTNSSKRMERESKPKSPEGRKIEKYKDLKKRMERDFKAIVNSCMKERTIPKPPLVERFYQDSKAMCNYPDKGDEFYEPYLIQTETFYEAFRNSNLKTMSSAITALSRIKKECHDKYK